MFALQVLFFNITCANGLISAAYGELANGNLAVAGALGESFDFACAHSLTVLVYLQSKPQVPSIS